MKIIKRNGSEVTFDIGKIVNAVTRANEAVEEKVRMTPLQIQRISQSVEIACQEIKTTFQSDTKVPLSQSGERRGGG